MRYSARPASVSHARRCASIGAAFRFSEFLAVLLVGSVVLGAYVAANSAEVNAAVLAAVESEVGSGNQRSMYEKFKPQLSKVVAGALPKIGTLVQKHAG